MKQAVERLLLRGGIARRLAGPRRDAVLILAYHNIRPDGAAPTGDRPLHLSLHSFQEQLDLLREHVDVVPLGETLAAAQSERPRVAITFDDAYQGAVTLGVAELVRRQLPATIFVTPEYLGGRAFWWDVLSTGGGLPEAVRIRALTEFAGKDALILGWARSASLALAEPPPDCRGASQSELRQAAEAPGITLGSHTWSHPNLARLNAEELALELSRPADWLRERFRNVLPWLSYPYGSWSPAVALAAEQGEYRAALRVDGGWWHPGREGNFSLPRLNVPAGISADGFALRLAGLFCR